MQDELTDRFGEIPLATENLLRIAVLKAATHRAFISQIAQKTEGIRFYLYPNSKIASENIPKMIESYEGRLRYIAGENPYILYKEKVRDGLTRGNRGATGISGGQSCAAEEIFQITEQLIEKMQDLITKNGESDEEKKLQQ